MYNGLGLIFLHPKIDTLFLPCFEDSQITVFDSRLDISTASERKWNILISKFGCSQSETNQIVKIEGVVIV